MSSMSFSVKATNHTSQPFHTSEASLKAPSRIHSSSFYTTHRSVIYYSPLPLTTIFMRMIPNSSHPSPWPLFHLNCTATRGLRVYPSPRVYPYPTRTRGLGTGRHFTGRVGYGYGDHGYGCTRFYPYRRLVL